MQRYISIEDSQVYWCDEDGLQISAFSFTAVNLAIRIKESNLQRNDGHGVAIENLALVECFIEGCNISKNTLANAHFY